MEKRPALRALILECCHRFRLETHAATVRIDSDRVVQRIVLPDESRPAAVGELDLVPATLLPVDGDDRHVRCGANQKPLVQDKPNQVKARPSQVKSSQVKSRLNKTKEDRSVKPSQISIATVNRRCLLRRCSNIGSQT